LLTESFTIAANEDKVVPFQMKIPYEAPATLGRTRLWIQTGLDIKMAIDPQDKDFLEIQPHPLVTGFIDAAQRLGFQLRQVDCEKTPSYFKNGLPFVQEFEFKPITGEFARKLDELEAVFQLTENEARVLLQVDRRARGFSSFLAESLNMDESFVKFSFKQSDLSTLDRTLGDMIRKYC
jgi:sporulation-control protein